MLGWPNRTNQRRIEMFSGTVVAVGSKVDIEKQLSEMEGNKEQGT